MADAPERCVQTMASIAKGLNISTSNTSVDEAVFDPVKAKVCSGLSDAEKSASIEEQLAVANKSGSYLNGAWVKRHELLAELQTLAGKGAAPPITEIPNHIEQ